MTAIPPATPSDLELDLAAIYAGAQQAEAFRAQTRKQMAEHGHHVEDRTVWSMTALIRLAAHWKREAEKWRVAGESLNRLLAAESEERMKLQTQLSAVTVTTINVESPPMTSNCGHGRPDARMCPHCLGIS